MERLNPYIGLDESSDEEILEESPLSNNRGSATPEERKLKTRLRYYFMSPCHKWKYRGRKPFKLSIQIAKIFLVTCQVCLFGYLSTETADYISSNLELFRTMFIHEDSAQASPPDLRHGGLAIPNQENFYYTVNYARKMYAEFENTTFGMFGTTFKNNSMKFELKRYKDLKINPSEMKYEYNPRNVSTVFLELAPWSANESISTDSIPFILNNRTDKRTLDFTKFISGHIHVNIRTIRLKEYNEGSTPDCLEHRVRIHYDNTGHSGIMGYYLSARQHYSHCSRESTGKAFQSQIILYTILDLLCLCLCLVSFVLCVRSIFRAQRLKIKFVSFFKQRYHRVPSLAARLHFLNFWYIGIIMSDFLIIVGSMMKMDMQNKWVGLIDYSGCQMLLGVGIGLTYLGLLRYIGYFSKYNILVTVLKASLPHCGRFLVTSMIMYTGFTLCGWLVLGPYNVKFRTITKTSECLFSLLNGDDMYNTFELLGVEDYNYDRTLVIFNQVYLYSFISIFIYVVLNLLLAVILQTYETVLKNRGGPEKEIPDELEKFLGFTILDTSDPVRIHSSPDE